MRISFVLATYRRPEASRGTLEARVTLDHPTDDYEIVVINDGSADSTPNWSMIGPYIFRGIREGLAQLAGVRDAAAGATRERFVSA